MTTPVRIRLSRAKGWRKLDNTVVVARPTKFGNPFGPPDGLQTGTRQMLVDEFVAWLRWPERRYRTAGTPGGFTSAKEAVGARQRLVDALPQLVGRNLGCWCHLDQPCHADALIDLAAGRLRVDPLRILVTGSRDWQDWDAVERAFRSVLGEWGAHPGLVTVVHGGAKGLDSIAHAVAWRLGMRPEPHPAAWQKYGRAAGAIRNAAMVGLGADLCLAWPLGASPGTRDCMRKADMAGIQVCNLGDPDPAGQLDLFEAVAR